MFGYLFHGIKSIHFQTELHEACDWDDEELEKVMNKVTVVLENIKLPDIPCDFSFFKENVLVPELAQQNLSKNQMKIKLRKLLNKMVVGIQECFLLEKTL